MKRTILTIATAAVTLAAAAAGIPELKVYDVDVTVNEADATVTVGVDLKMKELKMGSNDEAVFTPVIISADGTESLELDPITICGRNRWYWYMRQGMLDNGDDNHIYRAGSKAMAHMTQQVPFEAWMGHSTVEMRQEAGNCCKPVVLVPGPTQSGNTELAVIDTKRPQMALDFVYSPPVDDAPVEKNIEGKAFVSFVVNRTELKPDYMVNRREIAKILNSIDYVRNDTDAVITGIHIKGFASPEGPYTNNVRLAQGRTATLAAYVRDLYHFDKGIMTTSYEPEDWEGLRSYLTDSMDYNIGHREQILELIDEPLDPDTKDHTIRARYPEDYSVILKEIYPWLRHSDYTVKYRIKVYTELSELNRVYASDPTRLRPVDFHTIAAQYPEGSPEYLDVMKTAVKVYPDDKMLNLNAANIAMLDGRYDDAQEHLNKAGRSAEADYARGILAAKIGNYREAMRLFEKAKADGIDKAGKYIDYLQTLADFHPVTITVPVTKPAEE